MEQDGSCPSLWGCCGLPAEAWLPSLCCACHGHSPAVMLGAQTASDAAGWPSPVTPAARTDPVLTLRHPALPQLGLEMISRRKIKACGMFSFLGLEQLQRLW